MAFSEKTISKKNEVDSLIEAHKTLMVCQTDYGVDIVNNFFFMNIKDIQKKEEVESLILALRDMIKYLEILELKAVLNLTLEHQEIIRQGIKTIREYYTYPSYEQLFEDII